MTDDDPTVPVRCPDCGTETTVPLGELADTLQRHNDTRHDGAERARVDPELAAEIRNLVAEEMGLLE